MRPAARGTFLLAINFFLRCTSGNSDLPDDVPEIFYPFGLEENDAIAPINDDGSTQEIQIVGLPFFENLQYSLYVCIVLINMGIYLLGFIEYFLL